MISFKTFVFILSSIAIIRCEPKSGWFKKCPQVKPVSSVDSKAFSGDWFVVYRSLAEDEKTPTFCDKITRNYVNDVESVITSKYLTTDLKPVNISFNQFYDQKRPGHFFSPLSKNPILNKWYGELDIQILDIDYNKYALVYDCQSQYFGLKTQEAAFLLQKSLEPLEGPLQYRLMNLFKSFDYGGNEIVAINHNPALCKDV